MTSPRRKSGDRIGALTLISKNKKGEYYYWLCECECGVIKSIPAMSFVRKNFTFSCGCLNKSKTIQDYIDEYVFPEPNTGCWLWSGPCTSDGYGKISVTRNRIRKFYRAHRAIYMAIRNKYISPEIILCHRCDNVICVNPDHLFEGTVLDNALDMITKGRSARGSKQGSSKLKEQEVIQIRKLKIANPSIKNADLGRMFNVHPWTINNIIRKDTWTHV